MGENLVERGKTMTERESLVSKIVAQNCRPGDAIVSLEDFFTGNTDRGSIGCNLGKQQPAISQFYQVLREIRERPNVQNVFVRICEFDDAQSWPYSDTVYVLTSASLDEVSQWVQALMADEVNDGWMYGPPPKAPPLKSGIMPYSVWWD
jgi:hypothetical protein